MKFESQAEGLARGRSIRVAVYLSAALAVMLAFVFPPSGWAAAALIAAALYMRKEGGCALSLDDALQFSNKYIVATAARDEVQDTQVRGGGLIPQHLRIRGNFSVKLKNGQTASRSYLLLPDEFSLPPRELMRTIEDWKIGRAPPHLEIQRASRKRRP